MILPVNHGTHKKHSHRAEADHAWDLSDDLSELDGALERFYRVRLERQPYELHGGANVEGSGCVF